MRWKLIIMVLLAGAIAPELCVHFAGASVRAALQVLNGLLSPATAGANHG
jgi:hypothetical protein